jgi:hypothetical protein
VKQLVKLFLFQASRQADPRHELAPKPPAGLPSHVMVYHRFWRERGWHPREVDSLTREELFWLPIIAAAEEEAAEALRPKDKD